MPAGRFEHCHDNPNKDGLVLVDKGNLNYADAVAACMEEHMQIVVVRKRTELDQIQELIGTDVSFYLDGRTASNLTCSQSDCKNDHIEWLDGGKTYETSLYDGSFLNSEISEGLLHICIQVWILKLSHAQLYLNKRKLLMYFQLNVDTDPPTVEDVSCTQVLRAVCMADCAEWKTILENIS